MDSFEIKTATAHQVLLAGRVVTDHSTGTAVADQSGWVASAANTGTGAWTITFPAALDGYDALHVLAFQSATGDVVTVQVVTFDPTTTGTLAIVLNDDAFSPADFKDLTICWTIVAWTQAQDAWVGP